MENKLLQQIIALSISEMLASPFSTICFQILLTLACDAYISEFIICYIIVLTSETQEINKTKNYLQKRSVVVINGKENYICKHIYLELDAEKCSL